MSGDANVGSIDAVRDFRAALSTFLHESRDALVTYDLEARRALEWLLDTAPKMWMQERRKCQDKITELNIAYQACRAQKLPGGGQPACLEEKKALDKAKTRMVYIEDKIQKTRKWGLAADRQAIEYKGRATQLVGVLDAELPNALALLDRVITSLEEYVGFHHPGASLARDQAASPTASVANTPAEEKAKAAAGEEKTAGEKNGAGEGQAAREARAAGEKIPAGAEGEPDAQPAPQSATPEAAAAGAEGEKAS